jgi:hypothetical protein
MQSVPPQALLSPGAAEPPGIRLKGTSFQDAIAAVKRREGERRYGEIVASLPLECRRVFEGVIVPTSYYPLDAFVAFLDAGLRLSGDDERILIKRSEAVAEHQLGDTYRSFIRPGAPHLVIERIATIHRTFFAGAQIQVESKSKTSASIRYVGFRKEHRLIEYIQIGFYRKALDLCGARGVVVEASVPIAEGREYCELSISWR